MPHLARIGIALYLATYVVWAGPVTTRLWVGGGHATPEHWTVHSLLEQLGVVDHHAHASVAGSAESRATPPWDAGVSAFLLPLVQLTQAMSGVRTGPENAAVLGPSAPPETGHSFWERVMTDDPLPLGLFSVPIERPPAMGV